MRKRSVAVEFAVHVQSGTDHPDGASRVKIGKLAGRDHVADGLELRVVVGGDPVLGGGVLGQVDGHGRFPSLKLI